MWQRIMDEAVIAELRRRARAAEKPAQPESSVTQRPVT